MPCNATEWQVESGQVGLCASRPSVQKLIDVSFSSSSSTSLPVEDSTSLLSLWRRRCKPTQSSGSRCRVATKTPSCVCLSSDVGYALTRPAAIRLPLPRHPLLARAALGRGSRRTDSDFRGPPLLRPLDDPIRPVGRRVGGRQHRRRLRAAARARASALRSRQPPQAQRLQQPTWKHV